MRSSQELQQELTALRQRVDALEREVADARRREASAPGNACSSHAQQHQHTHARTYACDHSLSKEQVQRYSRHLLLPSFGLRAQERLCHGSVLIVGCGGLGSPAALYLAAAGVGTIGLVDHDVVDLSNLHRQVIHTEARVGVHKATSAAQACSALNSLVQVNTHLDGFSPATALDIVQGYDVVLDATDNPATRYLINDACVALGKPLVSAAAVGTDGQLTVYNLGEDAPCYRCLFPESPAPENCSRCADAGVLGPVPGVMGVLQAVEVCKLLGELGDVLVKKLLLYDALAGRFTSVRLRGKRPECAACGKNPAITKDNLPSYDYVAFTGQAPTDAPPSLNVLPASLRVTPQMLQDLHQAARASGKPPPTVLDVRPPTQFDLMHLPQAVHIPFEQLESRASEVQQLAQRCAGSAEQLGARATSAEQQDASTTSAKQPDASAASAGQQGEGNMANGCETANQGGAQAAGEGTPLFVMCRRGNNSQLAVARLRELGIMNLVDVVGGIEEWAKSVDASMPVV